MYDRDWQDCAGLLSSVGICLVAGVIAAPAALGILFVVCVAWSIGQVEEVFRKLTRTHDWREALERNRGWMSRNEVREINARRIAGWDNEPTMSKQEMVEKSRQALADFDSSSAEEQRDRLVAKGTIDCNGNVMMGVYDL